VVRSASKQIQMTRTWFIIAIYILLISCRKSEDIQPSYFDCGFNFADSSLANPNKSKYQAILNDMTANGVVGVTMAVMNPTTGVWIGANGKADLFTKKDMRSCNISRVGSTVKMLTATTVLKLAEEGKLDLDAKISEYLQGDVINKIENADKATVRQLLQHSSGIYNYIQNLNFQTASLNDFIRVWKPEDLLRYAYNQKAYFQPGEDVQYSNTGYIMLGMLIEKIEGKPFHKSFEEKLFLPYGLSMTSFAAENPIPGGTVRGYIDIYSNLQVIESTYFSGWDYYTADGGLISNPYDLTKFFHALMAGKIIGKNSLEQMFAWKNPKNPDPDFFPISYGLGIFKIITPAGIAYMHSGDAVGYYANMIYFPKDNSSIIYAVNSNYGKIDQFVSTKEAITKIISVIK
jgi:D-alanyl-D-alanine carboxypeptidase